MKIFTSEYFISSIPRIRLIQDYTFKIRDS